jgi:hypothetical protein
VLDRQKASPARPGFHLAWLRAKRLSSMTAKDTIKWRCWNDDCTLRKSIRTLHYRPWVRSAVVVRAPYGLSASPTQHQYVDVAEQAECDRPLAGKMGDRNGSESSHTDKDQPRDSSN